MNTRILNTTKQNHSCGKGHIWPDNKKTKELMTFPYLNQLSMHLNHNKNLK